MKRRNANVMPFVLAWFAAFWALSAAPAHATVTASVNNDRIAPGDTVQLTLEHDGQTNAQPDLAPLRKNFDVLGTSRRSSFEMVNGQTSSSTDVIVTLAPKHSGRLTIPRIAWGKDRSPALSIDVAPGTGSGPAGSTGTRPSSKVFVTAKIEPQRPYVQAAVHVTVSLFTAETLYHANLDLPSGNDAIVQQVGGDAKSSAVRGGRSYRVLTRHYVVFPQRSGTLELPGPIVSAQVASGQRSIDPFFGNDPFGGLFGGSQLGGGLLSTRPIRVHGKPIELHVRPRPASAAASYWLPAVRVRLRSQWKPQQLRAHAGNPLTVDLHLEAVGLTAAQLPDLSSLLKLPPGLKEYPDKAKLTNATQGGTVVGKRDQSIALIADRPGRFRLPALTVHWWDTLADRPRSATLPQLTLRILPAAGRSAAPAPSSTPAASAGGKAGAAPARAGSSHAAATAAGASATRASAAPPAASASTSPSVFGYRGLWPWISFGALLLWLATVGAWLWSRGGARSKAPSSREPAARRRTKRSDLRAALRDACRKNDAPAARRALLEWAAAAWPEASPAGLNALGRKLGDPARAELLRALDRACYAGGTWRGEDFAAAFGDLPAAASQPSGTESVLGPLYR